MKPSSIKLARQLLGLNQTEFAELLGWTSKRNIVNLERGNKDIMTQTMLAIECLLRRNNKLGDFEMIKNMQPILDWVLLEIKKVNEDRDDGTTISEDDTNQKLTDIFHDAANKFVDIDFEFVDDEDTLTKLFGYQGYCAIREAEQGRY